MAGKGAPAAAPAKAAAPAAKAAPDPAANGAGPIQQMPAPGVLIGGKTPEQVDTETAAAIAEAMSDIDADADAAWAPFNAQVEREEAAKAAKATKGKKGSKGAKKAEPAEEPAEEVAEDESDADDAEAADEGEDSEAEGDEESDDEGENEDSESEGDEEEPAKDGASFAGKRRALKKLEQRAQAAAQQNEQDAALLDGLFGKSVQARRAVKVGDVASARAAIELTLTESTGMTLDEAIVFLVDPGKAPSPEALRLRQIEKERAEEKAAGAKAQNDSAKAQQTAEAKQWIKTELGTDKKLAKLLKVPGFEEEVFHTLITKFNSGVNTPKKAALALLDSLKARRKALNAAFSEDPETAPAKRSNGSPPRRLAASGARANAQPMTTGDAIAETLLESGLAKGTDKRLAYLRGRKIGVA